MAFRARSVNDPPEAPPDPPTYPLVDSVPDVLFSEGAGVQTYDLNQHVTLSGPGLQASFLPVGALPNGVTMSASGILEYDGTSPEAEAPFSFEVLETVPPGTELASFTLYAPTTGTKAFTLGHVFKKGEATTVSVDLTSAQVQVRNRWNNGSVKYAVISGTADTFPLTVKVQTGSVAGSNITEAALIALNPQCTVAFTAIKDYANVQTAAAHSVTLASCLGSVAVFGADPNLHTSGLVRSFLGPKMSEFHYYRTTQDPHIRVWWYVRLYHNGALEIETSIENGWMMVANPGVRLYSATLTVNGTQRAIEAFEYGNTPQTILRLSDTQLDVQYARYGVDQRIICYGDTVNKGRITAWATGNIMTVQWDSGVAPQNPISISLEGHMHHTKWQNVQWYDTAPDVRAVIDGDYFKASGMVPNFIDNKRLPSQWANSVATGWFSHTRTSAQNQPYGEIGGLVRVYSTGSFSDDGIQTPILSFEALYFRDGFEESYWANEFYTRAEQYFSIYYRDAVTGLPTSPTSYTDTAINGKYSGGTSYGVGGQVIVTPEPFGRPYYYWDDQHSMSLGYLHYIISGRWTSLEKLQQQYSFGHFMMRTVDRNGADGLLVGRSDRGFWTQNRDTHLVATMLPDVTPGASVAITAAQAEFRTAVINVVENRIQWVYDSFVTNPAYSLGYIFDDPDTERINIYGVDPGDTFWFKMWMKAMTINGFARGLEVEVPISSEKWATYMLCLNHAWNWIAGALGTYATTGHPWRLAFGPYTYAAGTWDVNINTRGPLYTSWTDVYNGTWNNPDGGPLSGWYAAYVNEQGILEDTPGLDYMNSGGNNTPFTYRDSGVWHTVLYLGNVMYGLALGVDHGHAGCIASWNLIRAIGNAHWFNPAVELSYTRPSKCHIPRTVVYP